MGDNEIRGQVFPGGTESGAAGIPSQHAASHASSYQPNRCAASCVQHRQCVSASVRHCCCFGEHISISVVAAALMQDRNSLRVAGAVLQQLRLAGAGHTF